MSLQDTLENVEWMRKNEAAIKDLFPETWTHIQNFSGTEVVRMAYKMKLLGIDWRSEEEFGNCMVFFEKTKFMLRDGMLVKRNPHSVFKG